MIIILGIFPIGLITTFSERYCIMFKIKWNKANTLAAIYATGVLILTLTGVSIIVNIRSLYGWFTEFFSTISPIVYALVLAYVINPLLKFFEKQLISRLHLRKKDSSPRIRRIISLVITYATLLLLLFLIGLLVIPQIVGNYETIINNTSDFLVSSVEKIGASLGLGDADIADFKNSISEYATDFLSYIGSIASTLVVGILKFLLGLFISIFVLLYKEKLIAITKKFLASILSAKRFNSIMSVVRLTDRTFGRFFVGKIFDSLIIGVLSFVVFWIFRMPYYPMLSVIICVTNVIPYFGPIIGAIPCVILVMTDSVTKAVALAVMILIIQQLDGNVIGPKILGNATGLSSLWVVVSITIIGSFFGFVGMLVAVPLFSVLYTLVKERTEKVLTSRGLPTETSAYAGQNPIDLLEESANRRAENAPVPSDVSELFEEFYAVDPTFDSESYFYNTDVLPTEETADEPLTESLADESDADPSPSPETPEADTEVSDEI